MAENVSDPQLTDHTPQPRGVLQKNLKGMLYLGAVVILLAAAVLSAYKKPTVAEKAKDQPPQPTYRTTPPTISTPSTESLLPTGSASSRMPSWPPAAAPWRNSQP